MVSRVSNIPSTFHQHIPSTFHQHSINISSTDVPPYSINIPFLFRHCFTIFPSCHYTATVEPTTPSPPTLPTRLATLRNSLLFAPRQPTASRTASPCTSFIGSRSSRSRKRSKTAKGTPGPPPPPKLPKRPPCKTKRRRWTLQPRGTTWERR